MAFFLFYLHLFERSDGLGRLNVMRARNVHLLMNRSNYLLTQSLID
jgi:hypothetical protein